MVELRRKPTHMEGLDVRDGNGQDYGFIVYRYFQLHVAAAIPQERGFNCGRKQADLERASQVFLGKSLQA